MSAAVTYTTFGSIIVHERRNGVDHDYMRDPLGSTVGLLDSSQQISDTFAYWPYGEIQSQTGSTGTPFTFCGTLGYFLDAATQLSYVRARSFIAALARWLTVDPLWPQQSAYAYLRGRPMTRADVSGKSDGFSPCSWLRWISFFARCAMPSRDCSYCIVQCETECAQQSLAFGTTLIPSVQICNKYPFSCYPNCVCDCWEDSGGGQGEPDPGPVGSGVGLGYALLVAAAFALAPETGGGSLVLVLA